MPGRISVIFDFPNRPVRIELREDEAFALLTNILGMDTGIHQTTLSKVPPIPEAGELTEIILQRLQYKFSVEDVADLFLKDYPHVGKSEKAKWINALRSKLARLRDKIADEEKGTWSVKRDGKSKIYTFEKNITDHV